MGQGQGQLAWGHRGNPSPLDGTSQETAAPLGSRAESKNRAGEQSVGEVQRGLGGADHLGAW